MKKLLYDIAMFSFPRILRAISPFYKRAKSMSLGRKGWRDALKSQEFKGKRIWFHCASLGEFEQGRPLIEAVKKNKPEDSVIITFFSSSGYEIRKDYEHADYICYLPFDGKKRSNDFIEALQPDLAIFIKYEFWYYYLSELKKRRIPTFSVSAIFRPEQLFFKKGGGLHREMLSCFTHFFVQNEQSIALLKSQGFDNVTVSGDTRFDRVTQICANPKKVDKAIQFKDGEVLIVIGSSWPADMKVLYPIINDPQIKLKYIIAPHEISETKINDLCSGLAVNYRLFSDVDTATLPLCKVLIIDNIGLLSSLYQYGEIAYIGGAFGDGLHNILEAATFGMPILFGKGKDNHKYQEAVDLVKVNGAFEIATSAEAKAVLTTFLSDKAALSDTSKICRDYVRSKKGAAKIIVDFIMKYL